MTVGAKWALFFSSFAPLFVVFALLDSFGRGTPSVLCAGAAAFGAIAPVLVLLSARTLNAEVVHLGTVETRDADVMAYLATYLVPFAAVTAQTARQRGALAVFILMLAVLYVRSEMIYVNPLLAAVGYRLFRATTTGGASVMLITRSRFVSANTTISARRLGDYVYWQAR